MSTSRTITIRRAALSSLAPMLLWVFAGSTQCIADANAPSLQHKDTLELMTLVNDAAELVRSDGEAAFPALRATGSRWRQEDVYVFVLDPDGNMLVHPDAAMEGKNELDLKDVNGKPVIRGLIAAATAVPDKPQGWYHYQWPVPGGLLPRWKSSYVRLVTAPSGKSYVIGSGVYDDRMERVFVVDAVNAAAAQIEKHGAAAYPLLRDPTGPFIAKDTYVFVLDKKGVDLVNPAFPNLEGRNLMDLEDSSGKPLIREMFQMVETRGSGWVDYMWPKPGESVSTQKSAYVRKAKIGKDWLLVGSGVYLADAPRLPPVAGKMTAAQLMTLVRDAAAIFEKQGEQAYPEFRRKESRWFHGDTYFFVWSMDGTRVFHAANAELEGRNDIDVKDVQGRPYAKMFLDTAGSASGEGWVHYMYPEPRDIFPRWKSAFIKRVTFPSGKQYAVGCGIYDMQLDKSFVTDVVDRAAALIEQQGKNAFAQLRDRTGPFVFMDSYVFVESPEGIELVNPAHPSLEGKNLIDVKDVKGKEVVRDEISVAMKNGSGWVDLYWYKPGHNTPARKLTYVRKVQSGNEIYVVGSGLYVEE